MEKKLTICAVLLSLAFSCYSQPIIADHTVVGKFDNIPAYYINEVKKMWVSVAGESHSRAYTTGCLLLESIDARFQVNVIGEGIPESYTESYLRISNSVWGDLENEAGWVYNYGEEDWYTSPAAIERTKNGLLYCRQNGPELSAIGFGWCYDATFPGVSGYRDSEYNTRWGGESVGGPEGNRAWGLNASDQELTGNSVSMDTYLNATESYIFFCAQNNIPTRVFFTTGPIDATAVPGLNENEPGFQQYLKYEHIRERVNSLNGAYLLDFADILSFNNEGMQETTSWTDNNNQLHVFPIISDENLRNLQGNYSFNTGYHFGEQGALKVAKALWWLLARMAGWDGLIPASSITVTSMGGLNEITVDDGVLQLNANVNPDDATSRDVIWSVVNGTGMATISETGLLTALSDGTITAIATATDGTGVTGSLTVYITNQIVPDLHAGSISGNQNICYNTIPDPITETTPPSGGVGLYIYQWQSSPDLTEWTDIPEAVQPEYAPGNMTVSTYFRRRVTSGYLTPLNSDPVLINVYPVIQQARLSSNMVFYDLTPVSFSVEITGGQAPYIINFRINGVIQPPVTGYQSTILIPFEPPGASVYCINLMSVSDANGCNAEDLGEGIVITFLNPQDTETLIGAEQVPSATANNSVYELGTKFTVSAEGYIIAARLFTHENEGGDHIIRLWRLTTDDYFLVAGPVTWSLTPGTGGWHEYAFNNPVIVSPGETYIISISNGPDLNYVYMPAFSTTASNTGVHYVSGVYTSTRGFIPTRTAGSCYFRDIVYTEKEVNPFFGGRIGPAQTVCYNTAPMTLVQTVAPDMGTAFQWQISSDGLTWSEIPGAVSQTYSPGRLSENTYYRRIVRNGDDISFSNSVLVTVNPQFTLAQLHDDILLAAGGSTSFTVDMSGGSAPYSVEYSVNGTNRHMVTYYENRAKIPTGPLNTGIYVYSLAAVTDFYGCAPSSLGSAITATVTETGPEYVEMESLFGPEQVPADTLNDRFYELGSEFQVLSDGYLTRARIYSNTSEGGDHMVRLWKLEDLKYMIAYGPYPWYFEAGTAGWREFTFPEPVKVKAGGTYIITVSNSDDFYYTRSMGFSSTASGEYIRFTRGVYAKVEGGVPYRNYGGICFFRDVVFALLPSEETIPSRALPELRDSTYTGNTKELPRHGSTFSVPLSGVKAYPNPFTLSLSVEFDLASASHIFIEVYDHRGNRTATLSNMEYPAGAHIITWTPADDCHPGIYYLLVCTPESRQVLKSVLIR